MTPDLRRARDEDLMLLAGIDQRLVEDRGGPSALSVQQLRDRMAAWLAEGHWSIDAFTEGGTIVGYAVYQPRAHRHFPDR